MSYLVKFILTFERMKKNTLEEHNKKTRPTFETFPAEVCATENSCAPFFVQQRKRGNKVNFDAEIRSNDVISQLF